LIANKIAQKVKMRIWFMLFSKVTQENRISTSKFQITLLQVEFAAPQIMKDYLIGAEAAFVLLHILAFMPSLCAFPDAHSARHPPPAHPRPLPSVLYGNILEKGLCSSTDKLWLLKDLSYAQPPFF